MKKILCLMLIGALMASCGSRKESFTLKGTITGADSGMVYLQKYDSEVSDWVKIDSSRIDKGAFSFKGKVEMPEMWYLSIADKKVMMPLFIENDDLEVQIYADSSDKSVVTGSVSHDLYKSYRKQYDSLDNVQTALYRDYKAAREAKDTVAMNRADSLSLKLDTLMKKLLVDFSKSNPATVVAPYLILRNAWQFELPELEEIVVVFDTSLSSSIYVKSLQKRIGILRSVAIGQTAPDFSMADSTGTEISLSSFKGKYLLVDFWASWCGPCRGENPNVVKAWQSYHKNGFDVFGVSFDENRDKWLKAVKDDNLTWTHVSDLKGWGNAAGKLYGVNSIPANVLLDPDQKIIARNLRGEDLLKKLSELLPKK